MKIFKDKKVIILLIVLVVFTVMYFTIVNKISYAFQEPYDLTSSYNNTIEIIKLCAEKYAQDNKDIFKDDKIAYIKVQDLIDSELLRVQEDGLLVNPLNRKESLNSNIIKIKKEEDEFIVEVDA